MAQKKKQVKNGAWQVVKPRRSPRVQLQRNAAVSSDDKYMESEDSISTETENSAQLKLTDMICEMKKPSVPTKVAIVPLKRNGGYLNDKELRVESVETAAPSKTMTQQMIELLYEVEAKHQGRGSKTGTEDDSMDSGTETSHSVKWKRRQTLAMVCHVLGKTTEYLSDNDESNFACWWTNNVDLIPGISGTAVEHDKLVVYNPSTRNSTWVLEYQNS